MTDRRFPPPWSFDEANNACFVVRDHNGHAVAYVNFEQEPGRRDLAIIRLNENLTFLQ